MREKRNIIFSAIAFCVLGCACLKCRKDHKAVISAIEDLEKQVAKNFD